MSWRLFFTRQSRKDSERIAQSDLKPHINHLLEILKKDPYQNPPPYEKLLGDLSMVYSRRINIHHRLVYQIMDDIKTVKIIRMWTHYE